jgi:hypothetical protein
MAKGSVESVRISSPKAGKDDNPGWLLYRAMCVQGFLDVDCTIVSALFCREPPIT